MYQNLNRWKKNYNELCNKIEELETKAAKSTPSYSGNESGSSSVFNTDSKVETYSIMIVDSLKRAEKMKADIDYAEMLLRRLKSHQRYFIKSCLIYHTSFNQMAAREGTSSRNVSQIINNALIDLEQFTE